MTKKRLITIIALFAVVIICTVIFDLFLEITELVYESRIDSIDELISNWIYKSRTEELTSIMRLISFIGGKLIIVIVLLLLIFLILKKKRSETILLIITICGSALANLFVKFLIARARPSISPLIDLSDYSYPSGHSMNSTVFYLLLVYMIYLFTRNKLCTLISLVFAVIIIAFIGFSRVYLGVHYPSDVLGGYVFGLWWFLCIITVFQVIKILESRNSNSKVK